MTEKKTSTLIIKVDLQCCRCYKKIKTTLTKLQERENIRSIVYDEKNNVVTVSGPFDPKRLIKKICCKACKVIKDISIKEDKPPTPPPPAPEPAKPDPPPPAPEPEPEPEPPKPAPPPPEPDPPAPEPEPPAPEPAPAPPPPEPEPPAPAPAPPPPEPEPPKKLEPEPPKPEPDVKPPEPVQPYPTPVWTDRPVCCCRPWFEAYYGGCRCCSCGCVYGPVVYGGPCYSGPTTCQFICEEESSCTIM